MDITSAQADLLQGVDRAALVLAVVAGAVTVSTAQGKWGPFDMFVGALLAAMILGFHRPIPVHLTLRTVLMRLAFGLALSFAALITLAWPISTRGEPLSGQSLTFFACVAVVLALLERPISWLLDAGSPADGAAALGQVAGSGVTSGGAAPSAPGQ